MKLLLLLRRFAGMIAIRHNGVINGAVAEYHGTRRACHRRSVYKNLVFPDRQEEPVEIELLLLREPGPLPDAGEQILHIRPRGRQRDMRDAIERFFYPVIVFALTPFAPVPLVAPS